MQYRNVHKHPYLEEIKKALTDGTQSLCSENIEVGSTDALRRDFEKQYGKMNDQEFFECRQNLFAFFALLDDIAQEQETKKLKANEVVVGENVNC